MFAQTPLSHGLVAWSSRGGGGEIVPGDASVDLVLREDELVIAGPSTRWFLSGPDGASGTVGVRLPPGAAATALSLPLGMLRDLVVPAEDLLPGAQRRRWTAALGAWREDHEPRRLDLVGRSPAWVVQVRAGAERSERAGDVARGLGWSERSFRRRMHEGFGMGYATLVRVRRAQRARVALHAGLAPGRAALAAGYADQSHLSREARRVLGASPAQLLADSANRSMEFPSGSSTVA